MGGFTRAGGAEQIAPRRQGQPPIVSLRIIIKPELHPPGADADPSVDFCVVRGGDTAAGVELSISMQCVQIYQETVPLARPLPVPCPERCCACES